MMRKRMLGAAICGFLLASALPGAATNLDQVRAMCPKNPKCKPIVQTPGDKGQDFCIDSQPGGTTCETIVACPGDRTTCFVLDLRANRRKRLSGVNVDTILQGPAP
jgi:hypothetical protein